MGWTYLPPHEATRLRRGETVPVLQEVLVRQLQALDPGVMDFRRAEDITGRMVRVRTSIEGSLEAWELLKGLKTVFGPEEKRERIVRSMVPVPVEANSFHSTDELAFERSTRQTR
jgi:type I restriction enzyme R subunit